MVHASLQNQEKGGASASRRSPLIPSTKRLSDSGLEVRRGYKTGSPTSRYQHRARTFGLTVHSTVQFLLQFCTHSHISHLNSFRSTSAVMCKSTFDNSADQTPEYISVDDTDFCDHDFLESKEIQKQSALRRKQARWVPRNVLLFGILHTMAFMGVYYAIFTAKWATLVFQFVYWIGSVLGITAGAHRLWSHRSYKAGLPFRTMLMLLQTAAGQNSIYEWVRDHRCHHKWTDTDADPHNASRGLFFSHIGWLLQKKHPAVHEKGSKIDMSDLLQDPEVVFQKKFYVPLHILFCYLIPTAIPVYFWGELALPCYFITVARYMGSLHETWTINSFAHTHGHKPYDGRIRATDDAIIALVTVGEGGHNYHHTFPSDYRTSEFSYAFNLGKALIDFGAYVGQVCDRKVVGEEFIKRRIEANEALFGKSQYYEDFCNSWRKSS